MLEYINKHINATPAITAVSELSLSNSVIQEIVYISSKNITGDAHNKCIGFII